VTTVRVQPVDADSMYDSGKLQVDAITYVDSGQAAHKKRGRSRLQAAQV